MIHESTVHSNERSVFQCTYQNCDKEYLFEKNLKHHIQVDHEGKRFPCPIDGCAFVFKAKITQKRHVKNVHTNSKTPKRSGGFKHGQRHPKKGSTSLALELSGFHKNEIDKKLTKDIIVKSGKIFLSAEGLSNEISETILPILENNNEIESSDAESILESTNIKKESCIPDLLIPMRLWKNDNTETEEEIEKTPKITPKIEKCYKKSYDFSSFIVGKNDS